MLNLKKDEMSVVPEANAAELQIFGNPNALGYGRLSLYRSLPIISHGLYIQH